MTATNDDILNELQKITALISGMYADNDFAKNKIQNSYMISKGLI